MAKVGFNYKNCIKRFFFCPKEIFVNRKLIQFTVLKITTFIRSVSCALSNKVYKLRAISILHLDKLYICVWLFNFSGTHDR